MSHNRGRPDPSSPTKYSQTQSLSHHLPTLNTSDSIAPRLRHLSHLTKAFHNELKECAEDAEEAGLREQVQEMDEAWKNSWQEMEAMEERRRLFEEAATDMERALRRIQEVQTVPVNKVNWARNQHYVAFRQDIWVTHP